MASVVMVDMGGGNLGSVRYALERLGIRPCVTSEVDAIASATHVILPGVGAAPPAMRQLRELGLDALLRELRQPLLGICLGMQLLHARSEEGDVECLGRLPGVVRGLRSMQGGDGGLRVPHMGWNALRPMREDSLLESLPAGPAHAYFVHGYGVPVDLNTVAAVEYGASFVAVERCGTVCGMQCHPERSGALGARLLRNFLAL